MGKFVFFWELTQYFLGNLEMGELLSDPKNVVGLDRCTQKGGGAYSFSMASLLLFWMICWDIV